MGLGRPAGRAARGPIATRSALLLVVAAAIALLGTAGPAPAGAQTSGPPVLVVSSTEARIGERVVVRFEGWASAGVTVAICGNQGLRGAPDCDVRGGQGVGLLRGRPTLAELRVTRPPTPCPCVVRAVSATGSEVQIAPLEIVGVPVGPLFRPDEPRSLVTVSAEVSDVPRGLGGTLRALLGGRRRQQVSITLDNTSTVTLAKVSLGLAVGRTAEGARPVAVPTVEPLAPGETRVYDIPATVGAPAWGRYVWDVTADGAGPQVATQVRTSAAPWLLYALVTLLAADLGVYAVRRLRRRRFRNRRLWQVT